MNPCRLEILQALPGRVRIKIKGLKGNLHFAKSLEKTLRRNQGIKKIKANFQTGKALIIFNPQKLSKDELCVELMKNISYILQLVSPSQLKRYKKTYVRKKGKDDIFEPEDLSLNLQYTQVITAGVIILALTLTRILAKNFFLRHAPQIHIITTAATLVTGYAVFRCGLESVFKRKKLNNEMLITSAALVSILLKEGITGLVVVWLVNLSHLFQNLTLEKSRRAIKDILQGKEENAWVEIDGAVVSIPIESVSAANTVMCYLGEKIPVDGEVIDGEAAVSQAVITGESMPLAKTKGDKVYAGSIVEQGSLKIRAEKVGNDTSLARIIHLVEEASETRAPIQNIADEYSDKIVPLSFLLAALVYLITRDFKRSMTMLIVACPCAAGLATPTALSASMGNAAAKGILVKGGHYLEKVGSTDVILFDKTGTLTEGRPVVREVIRVNKDYSEEDIIQIAASLEAQTNHPLAKAVINKAEEMDISLLKVQDKEVVIGYGVKGLIDENPVLLGSENFIKKSKSTMNRSKQSANRLRLLGQTVLFLSRSNSVIGLIGVSDKVREESKSAIRHIRQSGIETIGLITGDCKETAEIVGEELGFDRIWSDTLPEGKVEIVKEYQQQGKVVTMVGDGVNDLPALANADVGISLGTGGTDVAIETANIVLAGDNPEKIYSLIALSNHTLEVIRQNFIFAIGINALGLLLGAGKIITPLLAALLHNVSTFGVVVNSSRLLTYNPDRNGKRGRVKRGRFKRIRG
ncbi:heavy metal translocating P-type ATPase [Desulfitibacter alkalitolerans]|uniref:heavy metal translocating P-type ATPase n=1 Tax=Desulfitibacter alkalitolerans TaxID=264641 RepID=UPI000688A9BD|nr:cation-translocating P-type ATPase [Desulfitibacter alkalitolerans]